MRDISRSTIWGIGGPAVGRSDPFILWRVPLERVEPGERFRPEIVRSGLPISSEGLLIEGATATVVIDGKEDKNDATRCDQPSGQLKIDL